MKNKRIHLHYRKEQNMTFVQLHHHHFHTGPQASRR